MTLAMPIFVSGAGFSFTKNSVGGAWSWSISAANVSGSSQEFSVSDITSPFGRLGNISIPIPGDVITAMAESLSDLQNQLVPSITLVSGTPTSYSITITEGDSSSSVASIPFTNSGAFGSFLTASSTPGSSWLSSSPAVIPGLGKNRQAQFNASVVPSTMLSSLSPYSGYINLQDVNNPSTVIPITFNVIVLPKPEIGVSSSTVNLVYSMTSGIVNGAQQSIITNTGPGTSILNFTAAKIQNISPWLSFTPSSSGPLGSGDDAILTFSIVSPNVPMLPGTYTEIVQIASRTAVNSPRSITVVLTVTVLDLLWYLDFEDNHVSYQL